MARIPLIGGAYQAKSIIANAQRCVNLYPEANPQSDQPPSPATHYPTPGLVKVGEIVPPEPPNIWVVSQSCAILKFLREDTGNVPPTVNIVGSNTQLTGPFGDDNSQTLALSFDSSGQKFVFENVCTDLGTNAGLTSVLVFSRGANGNVAPTYSIAGDQTGLIDYFVGLGFTAGMSMCLDGDANIYVGQFREVRKFPAGTTGNVASDVFIPDATKILSNIASMTFDPLRQWIWFSLDSESDPWSNVQAYDLSGNLRRGIKITGYTPAQIAIAEDGAIWVAVEKTGDLFGSGVMRFAANASGSASPNIYIFGASAGIKHASGVGIDNTTGQVYVGDCDTNAGCSIACFANGANGNVAPIRRIRGDQTQLGLLPSGDLTDPYRIVMHP